MKAEEETLVAIPVKAEEETLVATLVMVVRHLITLKLLVMETEQARDNGKSFLGP